MRRRLARQHAELARRIELDRANGGLLRGLRGVDGRTWMADVAVLRSAIHSLGIRLAALRSGAPRVNHT